MRQFLNTFPLSGELLDNIWTNKIYTYSVVFSFGGGVRPAPLQTPTPPAFKWTHFLSPCKSLCPVIWETIWRGQHPTKIWQGVDWRVWRVGCTPRKWVGRPGRGQGPRVRLSKTLLVQLNAKSQRNKDSQFWLWIHKRSRILQIIHRILLTLHMIFVTHWPTVKSWICLEVGKGYLYLMRLTSNSQTNQCCDETWKYEC